MKTVFNHMSSIHFLKAQGNVFTRTTERLSSGMKINHAADDPTGLALHSGFRARIHGVESAVMNVEEALTMFNVQDAALAEIQDMLLRIRDLAVRASNDAVLKSNCQDRTRLNNEVQALKGQIKKSADTATFNTKQVLVGNPIKEMSVENETVVASGEHPTWGPTENDIAFEAIKIPGSRYPSVSARRIWSRDDSSGDLTMETPDPPNAPRDADGDGFVRHPLSDPDDNNPDIPNGVDTDGDMWPDPIDPFPNDPAWPLGAVDADGDGFVDHPDIDPDPLDGTIPAYVNTDADNDGYVDHPWMDPDDGNKSIPDVTFDRDGDGVPDLLDLWVSQFAKPAHPGDNDGDGEINKYDPWPDNGSLTAANPPDADGDGWPTAIDPNDGDPLNPGGPAPDADGDGVVDLYDPWPGEAAWNPANPKDQDGDGVIDAWDIGPGGQDWKLDPNFPLNLLDVDADGIPDVFDLNVGADNDLDNDGIMDSLDGRPADPNYPISTRVPGNDVDGDGYPDDANGYFDPNPGDPDNPALTVVDTDGDGWPDLFDQYPEDPLTPGAGQPADADGDGFPDHYLFDPDPTDPAVPFDDSVDADGDKYPDYIDGGPGNPAGDDSNEYLPLTHICYEDRNPDWSGSGLIFASNRNNPYTSAADPWVSDIFVVSNGVVTAITNDADIDEQPAWSADGKYITWLRNGTDVYYAEMSGCAGAAGAPQMLTAGDNPVFDPNSTMVYYNNGNEIWYMDVQGGAATPLLDSDGNTVQGDAPVFSAGGDMLMYTRGGETYTFDLAREQESVDPITGLSGIALADWSPAGGKVAYEDGGKIKFSELVIEYEPVYVQVGPDNTVSDTIEMIFPDARMGSLGIGTLSVDSQAGAEAAIDMADAAIERVSNMRTSVGDQYNRLSKTLDDLYLQRINLMAAASSIGDANAAVETTELARANILSANAISVAAQGADINRNQTIDLLHENIAKLGL